MGVETGRSRLICPPDAHAGEGVALRRRAGSRRMTLRHTENATVGAGCIGNERRDEQSQCSAECNKNLLHISILLPGAECLPDSAQTSRWCVP